MTACNNTPTSYNNVIEKLSGQEAYRILAYQTGLFVTKWFQKIFEPRSLFFTGTQRIFAINLLAVKPLDQKVVKLIELCKGENHAEKITRPCSSPPISPIQSRTLLTELSTLWRIKSSSKSPKCGNNQGTHKADSSHAYC